MDYVTIIAAVGAGVVRSIGGWLENALEDGKISSYEWGQLGATVVRVGLISLGLSFGLNMDALAAGAGGVVADYILKALKTYNVKE